MTAVKYPVLALCALMLSLSACSSLNTRDDYLASRKSLEVSRAEAAKHELPAKESAGFISLMERTYLSLLDGNPDIDQLFRYSEKIDGQVQYKVSREAGSFFYVVTPEDYYASEHEIIWMHMLLSWGFSMRGNCDDARVEAKVAANFLSMKFSPKGRFDDPFMRVFLASLWTMCGDWEEARVDLRRAADLDPKLAWARQLASLDEKPADFSLILCGTGPEPVWNPKTQANIIRGVRSIGFELSGQKRAVAMRADGKNVDLHQTTDASRWYERHFRRNNEIANLIDDSKYAQRMTGTALKAAGIATGGYLIGATIITGGLALGGGLCYLAIANAGASGAGDVFAAGILVGGYGCVKGGSVIGETNDLVRSEVRSDLDISPTYRYVRFLPEYAWLGWSRKKPSSTELYAKDAAGAADISFIDANAKPVNGVRILFYPDVR